MTLRYLCLRTKIILSFFNVIILGGLLALIFGLKLVGNTFVDRDHTKVRYNLAPARIAFNEKLIERYRHINTYKHLYKK